METTNPRARIDVGWAPPPRVSAVDTGEAPHAADEVEGDEEAFDAALGLLVEQFAQLPPASYGEPPVDLSVELPDRASSAAVVEETSAVAAASPRSPMPRKALTLAASIAVGAGLALGALFVTGELGARQAPQELRAAAAPERVEIKVLYAPQTEPLDEAAPATTAQREAKAEEPSASPAREKRVSREVRAARKRVRRRRTHRRRARRRPATPQSEWADPYQ